MSSRIFVKNIGKSAINLYDLNIVLQPSQVLDIVKNIDKCYTLPMLNNSISNGSIAKYRKLERLIFTKNIDNTILIKNDISLIPIPSRCKIKKQKSEEVNEEVLLIEGEEDLILDEWLDKKPGETNG